MVVPGWQIKNVFEIPSQGKKSQVWWSTSVIAATEGSLSINRRILG
jgi:hypothetical protein